MAASWLAMIVAWVAIGCAAVLLAIEQRRLSQREREQGAFVEDLKNDIAGLCAGAVGLGDRLGRVEKLLRDLGERQDRLAANADSDQPYGPAIRMVHGGANVDDLMATCDLTRAEAELLVRLHGYGAAERHN